MKTGAEKLYKSSLNGTIQKTDAIQLILVWPFKFGQSLFADAILNVPSFHVARGDFFKASLRLNYLWDVPEPSRVEHETSPSAIPPMILRQSNG